MAIQLPAKKYFSFPELARDLACNSEDLLHLVMHGELAPSIYIDRANYVVFRMDDDPFGGVFPSDFNLGEHPERAWEVGFHYLIYPRMTGPASCDFSFFSAKPRNHKMGDFCNGLGESIGLAYVWEHGVVMATELDRLQDDGSTPKRGAKLNAERWPWGDHHTELLGHLEAAAGRFWVNYDPTDSTTAPTNVEVSDWLHLDRKVSRTMADAIASMLRVDGLPTGPRK